MRRSGLIGVVVLVVVAGVVLLFLSRVRHQADDVDFVIATMPGGPPTFTPVPTLTPLPTATPGPSPTPAPTVTPLPTLSPTPAPLTHSVAAGESMWAIALSYGMTLEELEAANPEYNPDDLAIGDELVIPGLFQPTAPPPPDAAAPPGAAASVYAEVATEDERLRMRSGPGEGYEVIAALEPGTALEVVGQSADGVWLQADAPVSGVRGWVMAQFVSLGGTLDGVPVTGP